MSATHIYVSIVPRDGRSAWLIESPGGQAILGNLTAGRRADVVRRSDVGGTSWPRAACAGGTPAVALDVQFEAGQSQKRPVSQTDESIRVLLDIAGVRHQQLIALAFVPGGFLIAGLSSGCRWKSSRRSRVTGVGRARFAG